MVDIKSRCGRILVIEARQIDVGTFQLLAAADGHRALSGRGRVRKKWGWAVHTGWLLPRQGAWSCGRLPRSIKCRSYDLQGLGVGSSMGYCVPELAAARLAQWQQGT